MEFETKIRQGWLPEKPSLSLPKGGGAIRGLGEKFQVNSSTGTSSLAIPLQLPAARALTPTLALQYESTKGSTPFGLSWDVGVSSIHRRTEKTLPQYNDEDIFLLSGSEELIPIGQRPENQFEVTRYRPRVEASFARIERWEKDNDIFWIVTSQDNITSIYGKNSFNRIVHPEDSSKIFQWLLEESYDDKGNHIYYHYKAEDGVGIDLTQSSEQRRSITSQRYLQRISYGTTKSNFEMFHVVFDYGEYVSKMEEEKKWNSRPDPFSTYKSGFEIRTYRLCERILIFHQLDETSSSLVSSVELSYDKTLSFSLLTKVISKGHEADGSSLIFAPLTFDYSKEEFDDTIQSLDPQSRENLPIGLDSATYQWVDLYQEGLSGVLVRHENTWYYKKNQTAGRLGPLLQIGSRPSLQTPQEHIATLAGEGRPCLVQQEGVSPGYFPLEDERWGTFIPFTSVPKIDWNDPHLKQVDLNGDGFPDLLFSGDGVWIWHPSLGKDGFGPEIKLSKALDENQGPTLVFAYEGQAIYFADMSGDGLSDIVWIENGCISYWPNLGYGHFGSKVVMDNPPLFDCLDHFDPKRLRLGDINGNGTTDILYLGKEEISYWLNQAGNGWSMKKTVSCPPIDHLSSVNVFDLLGTGTSCLVWSSSLEGAHPLTLQYIDLLKSTKPHLLTSIDNHIGCLTTITYKPSTFYYISDQLQGRPWKTKLPFPMHLVSQLTITDDKISGQTFTTQYTYHDGYYDIFEREFRGFGFVESIDDDPNCNPILKKNWIHLGLDVDFSSDYYQGDSIHPPLESPSLPSDLSPSERREALRSLKGRSLREEIFIPSSEHPFLITEHTHQTRLLIPQQDLPYPVFLPLSYQTRQIYYEKSPIDPRVSYEAVLKTDDWGQPLATFHMAYKKRLSSDYPSDQKNHTTATFYTYTHAIDSQTYLAPLIAETQTYEVHNPDEKLLSFEELSSAQTLKYDQVLTTSLQRRLIEDVKYLYADKTGILPWGQIGVPVLPGQTLQMAFPNSLISSIFSSKVSSNDLTKAGYIQDPTDQTWWVPSDRITFDPTLYYLPIEFHDPFGNTHTITYDPYPLKPISFKDPLGNVISATYDYRLLQPTKIVDINGNTAEAAYNSLGLLVTTAIQGKNGEGDLLESPVSSSDPLHDDPEKLLGNATTRICYNFEAPPIFAYVLSREKHRHQLRPGEKTRILKSVAYTDGFGKLIQTKSSAPEGKWVVSGWTVYNRRGLPIQKYEPFFHDSPVYKKEIQGYSSTLYYDSKDRMIATRFPNETYEKATFKAWSETHWDANNTVLVVQDSDLAPFFTPNQAWVKSRATAEEKEAAEQTKTHQDAYTTTHLDTLGRPFLVIKKDQQNRTVLDIEGNKLAMTDTLGRTISESQYDMLGHPLHTKTLDAGESWIFLDVVGKAVRSWDIEGNIFETSYDALHRPVTVSINGSVDERITYGESLPLPEAKEKNLLGKVVQHENKSVVETTLRCDFKGNIVSSQKKVGEETFPFEADYDALNHVTTEKHPDQSQTIFIYDDAGHLWTVTLLTGPERKPIVTSINYNAQGQRTSITYGNNVTTTYQYDELTDRLALVQSKKEQTTVQDQTYTYDPVGNITHIYDRAQPTVIRNGIEMKPILHYIYDPYYRLIEATGREHINALQPTEEEGPLLPVGDQNDLHSLRPYTEQYVYDDVGNLSDIKHYATQADWIRHYTYFPNSNRLQSTTLPGLNPNLTASYDYDQRGNMLHMPHLSQMRWDEKNHLVRIENQNKTTANYSYDHSGSRVKKVVLLAEGLQEETFYLGGFEIFRRTQAGVVIFERRTLHLMDGNNRVALFEVSTTETRLRFQLTNHLHSSILELDENGVEISYEEYHPFGSTAIRTGLPRRYRYNGKEKDEETSLYYYGARYYACWLGRWTSPDPAGFVDGPNLYVYVKNNPVTYSDPTGHFGWSDFKKSVKGNWKEVAVVAAVAIVVTVLTAGVGTVIIGGAAASAGAVLTVGAVSGAAGSVAAGALSRNINDQQQTGKEVAKDAAIGAVAGLVGAASALKLAQVAKIASTTSKAARIVKGAAVAGGSGVAAGSTGELTREVVNQEKIDPQKIGKAGLMTGAISAGVGGVTALKAPKPAPAPKQPKPSVPEQSKTPSPGLAQENTNVVILKEGEFITQANPNDIKFSQPTVSSRLSTGQTINELAEDLRSGRVSPSDIPPINVVEYEGNLVTLDNRRLLAFLIAGIKSIPIRKVSLADPKILEKFLERYNPVNGGNSIVVVESTKTGRKPAEDLLREHGKIK